MVMFMENKELVSIIVPVYNVKKYLDNCLESIINQTYKSLEIILVDDGSTDGSSEICDNYRLKDNRIVVIHKQNGGLSSAKNAGLEVCKGNYISFVDSDDYVDSNFIEELYNNIQNTNSDISLCNYYTTINGKDYAHNGSRFILEGNEKYTKLFYTQTIVSWNKLYKRKLFEKLRFPEKLNNEDSYILLDLLHNSNKISYMLDKCLYHYVRRKNSISSYVDIKSLNKKVIYDKIVADINKYNLKINKTYIEFVKYMELRYTLKKIDLVMLNNEDKLKYNETKYDLKSKKYLLLRSNDLLIYDKLKLIVFTIFPKLYIFLKELKK